MKLFSPIVALSLGLSFPLLSEAENKEKLLPAEGTANYTTYYVVQRLSELDMGKAGSQWVQEMSGITRNTDGEPHFDNMAVRCLGYVQQVMEDWFWTGACTESDSDGDQVFTTFDMEAHRIVGGTGKYQGISGEAPYSSNDVPRIGPNTSAGVVDHEISWVIQ